MIKPPCPLAATLMLLCSISLLLLGSACAPTTTAAPSAALKQQFMQLQQQQKMQATQLQTLQEQLAQIQQRLMSTPGALSAIAEQPPALSKKPQFVKTKPITIPAAISQEVSALTDSAANYLAAFSNLAAGRYPIAETGFNNFLREYPQHHYSANARYWLASSQVSQGKLRQAASNLRQVIVDNEGQDRAPSALALLARIYQQQQMTADAEEVLNQLRIRYPESKEAEQLLHAVETQQ